MPRAALRNFHLLAWSGECHWRELLGYAWEHTANAQYFCQIQPLLDFALLVLTQQRTDVFTHAVIGKCS